MLTVAVCEDDVALRSVLVRALRQAGHETLTAGSGTEAVRGFWRRAPTSSSRTSASRTPTAATCALPCAEPD